MQNKKIFITQEVADSKHKEDLEFKKIIILPRKSIDFFQKQKNKNQTIHIYDLGFNNTQKIIPINNHINKTGSNPLYRQNNNKIIFYDITNIYQQQKKGKTAECFGLHQPPPKKNSYIQARFLCHHTIAAHCAGFKKIFAYIIG